jgi:diguanylate cyclase (GGDEF)-like protein
MPKPRLTSQQRDPAALTPHESDESRELVGWALDPTLRENGPKTVAVARRVLATALGMDVEQLRALDPVAVRTALTRLHELAVHIERLASTAAVDELTGCLRRGAGIAALEREIARARRTNGSIVIVFIDVDGLKSLNDSRGHAAGDRLLKDVVAAIRKRIRAYDLVFRYGGDEFVCVLIDVTTEQAQRTAAEIVRNVSRRTGGHTLSCGYALMQDTDSAESVLQRADADLYRNRAAALAT